MPIADFTWADLTDLSLSVFLLAAGLGLGYVLLRLGGAFGRLSSFIHGTERAVLPVISKVGASVDKVNAELDKVGQITDSAVDMADSVDTAVRSVSMAISKPVQKVSGFAAGVTHGASAFRASRDWSEAKAAAKAAAARREAELADELRHTGSDAP